MQANSHKFLNLNPKASVALTLLLLFGLSGCAASSNTKASTGANQMAVSPLTIDEKISQAAESVRISLGDLARAEQAGMPQQKSVSNKVPPGLDTRLNVTWNGPIQQFMAKAAELSGGYTLTTRGKVPAIPVLVSVNRKNVTLYELLRDVATQAGARANITVDIADPAHRQLILEFQV